jgi:hypothetical protein
LVRNGVPFDVAFTLSDEDRLDWIVAIAGLDGLEYDGASRTWKR